MSTWMKSTPPILLAALTSMQAFAPQAMAKGSVDATQLEVVALGTTVPCNRTMFQGSLHYPNTVFVTPRVTQGNGADTKRSIEIIPTAAGQYLLHVKLHFPTADATLKSKGASSYAIDKDACNFDVVKEALNENREPSKQIHTVARLPLTSIEVAIPGIIKEVARIGRSASDKDEADFLDYAGKTLTFIFNISEDEKRIFESQVVKIDGVAAQVKFRFQARSRDGSVRAEIDAKALQANFLAQAKGRVYMVDADVKAALRASMDSKALKITAQAGQSKDSNKIIEDFVEKILKETSFATDSKEDKDKEKDKGDKDEKSESKIAVKAVLETIATKVSRAIEFDQVAAAETATAQTERSLFATRVEDPNIIDIAVQAGYQDSTQGVTVNAGQTFTIVPAYTYVDTIEYKDKKTFVTPERMTELDLAAEFPEITSSNMKISKQNINGTVMAVGKWSYLGGWGPSTFGQYRWIQIERPAVRTRGNSKVYDHNLETLKSIPVGISFSASGDRYRIQLAEIIGNNDWWTAYHDQNSGRIIITAKKDLGRVTFRESMKGPENLQSAPVVLNEVVMEYHEVTGGVQKKKLVLAEDKDALTKQRTIVLNMTRPVSAQKKAEAPTETEQENGELGPRTTFEIRSY